MTTPPMMRLFFAVDLSHFFKERVGEFLHELKKKTKGQQIRFSRQENLHITLQFLPEVKSSVVEQLIASVTESITGFESFNINLAKIVLFPNPYRPRVIVLDIEPQQIIKNLSLMIGQSIQSIGLPIEEKSFRAHLTIGRITNPQDVNLRLLPLQATPQFPALIVDQVKLYRSEPQTNGSNYTELAVINF